MKRASIICFAIIFMFCCECLGRIDNPVLLSANVPTSEQSAQNAAGIETKTSMVDVFCPTTNEEARRFYNDALEFGRQGLDREAEQAYLKAIEMDPQYCDAMDNVGRLFRRKGDIKQAITWYNRSIAVKPDNVVAHQNLAVAYRFLGDADRALSEYQWLVGNDSGNPEGYYGLGLIYLEMGQPAAAIKPLERAEALYQSSSSPFLGDAQYLLGQCYLQPSTRDRRKAREYLMKAQQLGVEIPQELLRAMDE